jgi:glycosyltransferase involved in cell wall biosynthesis
LKNIKYVSFYENSGYAVAAKAYIEALAETGAEICWTPLKYQRGFRRGYLPFDGSTDWGSFFREIQNRALDYSSVIVHTIPELYPEWRQREPDKYLVGYTVWETTKPPAHWKNLINRMDHLLVPTEWNKLIFQENGVTIPIDVIPHISEFEGEPSRQTNQIEAGPDTFLFYVISAWTERKALWKVLEAYIRAFSPDDNVKLLLKTNQIDTTRPQGAVKRLLMRKPYHSIRDTVNRFLESYDTIPAIELVDDDTLPKEYIRQLHTRGDCFVSLCRSEGWGIGAFEAAMYGNPVIMTGFGGQTAYLPDDKAHLIDYDLVSVADKQAPKSYNNQQKWAEPDVEQAAEKMREIYGNQQQAKKMGTELKEYVHTHFSREVTTDTFRKILEKIP